MEIGWFSTGEDWIAIELLRRVQKAIRRGEIKARIKFVFSNQEVGESQATNRFLSFASDDEALPIETFSSKKFKPDLWIENREKWRREYDSEVIRQLKRRGFLPVDLIVLAGYMLIVGEEMCQKYKMINLHPAAPGGPTGTWQEVIWKLIATKAEYSGVMMHLVTPELDKGPPVTYCTFPIRDESNQALWEGVERGSSLSKQNLFWEIRRRGLQREFSLILATLKAFSQGKVRIEEGRIVNARGEEIPGYNLTEEIDTAGERR